MSVYLDNAATTKPYKMVEKIMAKALMDNYGNPSSIHGKGVRARKKLEEARELIAKCLNCSDPESITFTSGGTEANNQAILTGAVRGYRAGKKHIITSTIEHPSVLNAVKRLEDYGFEATYIDPSISGLISAGRVANAIRDDTCLVSIMMVNNELGTIQPIAEIAAICYEKDVLFHTDAVQAVGHIPVDVDGLGVDMLSFSSHKFHGPKGIGGLYCADSNPESLLLGGAQELWSRAGTENVPGILATAYAMDRACSKRKKRQMRIDHVSRYLYDQLFETDGCIVFSEESSTVSNIVPVVFEDVDAESLVLALSLRGIYVSAGAACHSVFSEPSHVLRAIGMPEKYIHSFIRISISEFTTEDDVDYLINALDEVLPELRRMKSEDTL